MLTVHFTLFLIWQNKDLNLFADRKQIIFMLCCQSKILLHAASLLFSQKLSKNKCRTPALSVYHPVTQARHAIAL